MAVVQVHIDASGRVVEQEVHGNKNPPDVIVWLTAPGNQHTIVFVKGSPFAETVFQVPGGRAIRGDAALGRYKYDVYTEGARTDDPDVIVD
jgi:hypothetical protein